MKSIWQEVRTGWQESLWGSYFALALVPTVAVAFALTILIDGKVTTPPSALTWVLCIPAALASLYWAGLRTGPVSWLGRLVFATTLVFLIVADIRQAQRAGVSEFTFNRRIGRFSVTAQVQRVSEIAVSEIIVEPSRQPPEWWRRFRHALQTLSLAFDTAGRATWSV